MGLEVGLLREVLASDIALVWSDAKVDGVHMILEGDPVGEGLVASAWICSSGTR